MYENHDHTESPVREFRFDFDQELPEPLDHWSLRDFGDIVPTGGYAS